MRVRKKKFLETHPRTLTMTYIIHCDIIYFFAACTTTTRPPAPQHQLPILYEISASTGSCFPLWLQVSNLCSANLKSQSIPMFSLVVWFCFVLWVVSRVLCSQSSFSTSAQPRRLSIPCSGKNFPPGLQDFVVQGLVSTL